MLCSEQLLHLRSRPSVHTYDKEGHKIVCSHAREKSWLLEQGPRNGPNPRPRKVGPLGKSHTQYGGFGKRAGRYLSSSPLGSLHPL
jgi:hypothetical protein